jgi:hypothetical protein
MAAVDDALVERIVQAIRLSDHGAVRLDRLSWTRFGALLAARGIAYDEGTEVAYEAP